MRTRLTVALPLDATDRQLAALAALADQLGAGRWDYLATSFTRLDQQDATVPGPMGQLLHELAAALRRAGTDRATAPAAPGPDDARPRSPARAG